MVTGFGRGLRKNATFGHCRYVSEACFIADSPECLELSFGLAAAADRS
jgi:hypothetical protein